MNATCGAATRVLSQDYRAFYFRGDVTRENIYRRRTDYASAAGPPAEQLDELEAAGFTHLLVADADGPNGIRFEPALRELVDDYLATAGASEQLDPRLVMLKRYGFVHADGARRDYRLFLLRTPGRQASRDVTRR